MATNLHELLQLMAERGASDLHITTGSPPQLRINGKLTPIGSTALAASDTKQMCYSILTEAQKHRFEEENELDLSFGVKGLSRFRANIFVQRGAVSGAIRSIPFQVKSFEELGLPPVARELVKKPRGLILVTGPTGSGKTTTLYAALSTINSVEKNIITIEDPVEYELPLIRQTQVNVKAGLTFANGLRSILRQDPDIIMVGEIRDKETSEIAIQASLTGHLVFSTLHTNNAPSALTRLLDMGIEPYLISSSIIGILAQRLVRAICPKCKESYEVQDAALKNLKLTRETKLFHGKGCLSCKNTGFQGRIGIFELLLMNDEIKNMVTAKTSANEIRKKAIEQGMSTLYDDGMKKVKSGITTPEELLRVTEEA